MKQEHLSYCRLPIKKRRVFRNNVSVKRKRLILSSSDKWMNGTQLNYFFFDQESDGQFVEYDNGSKEWATYKGTEREKEVVREAFEIWKGLGIGLEFEETYDINQAEIRIGFMRNDGSWSWIGRDILTERDDKRTMNFGWNIENEIDTALHEIGHTLGFHHAHQNPNAGIIWNKDAVYEAIGKEPNNWDKKTVDWNILRKISPMQVLGSDWDPDSIMQYPFGPGLIKKPEHFRNGLRPAPGLSELDIKWVRFFYPELKSKDYVQLESGKHHDLALNNGEQRNFIFKPEKARKYKIETFGKMDALMVLFKKDKDGKLSYLKGDDDSGKEKSAKIEIDLNPAEEYVIAVRQFYNENKSAPILIH